MAEYVLGMQIGPDGSLMYWTGNRQYGWTMAVASARRYGSHQEATRAIWDSTYHFAPEAGRHWIVLEAPPRPPVERIVVSPQAREAFAEGNVNGRHLRLFSNDPAEVVDAALRAAFKVMLRDALRSHGRLYVVRGAAYSDDIYRELTGEEWPG